MTSGLRVLCLVAAAIAAVPAAYALPVAPDESYTLDEDSSITIAPGISDPDGTVTITSVRGPTNGTASHNQTAIIYAPDANRHGSDTLEYTVTGAGGQTATGTITITISTP